MFDTKGSIAWGWTDCSALFYSVSDNLRAFALLGHLLQSNCHRTQTTSPSTGGLRCTWSCDVLSSIDLDTVLAKKMEAFIVVDLNLCKIL